MIEAKDIKKIYPGIVPTVALDGVSFLIKEGEFVAIVGPSGSGKSTLMHIMGFLDRPTSGVYKFRGKSIDELDDDQLARIRNKEMGFVFQSFNLLPRTTVLDNVKLPLLYSGIAREQQDRMAREALKKVGLSHRLFHYPNQLSGGEQQRVAIARAIVNHPSVIFADEPTGNLDSKSGQQIMDILQNLNDQGHTIILVTHEKYTAQMAKRIIQLKDGRIVDDQIVAHRRLAKDGLIK
ncbi:ABC transporter ATP-binding protein [bacterium]|nr:ABC transporter ATP-binding protein [bacterium]